MYIFYTLGQYVMFLNYVCSVNFIYMHIFLNQSAKEETLNILKKKKKKKIKVSCTKFALTYF